MTKVLFRWSCKILISPASFSFMRLTKCHGHYEKLSECSQERHPMITTDNWKRTACRSCGPSVNYSEGNSWDRSLVFGLASCRSIWCCVFVIKYSFWKCRFNIVIDAFNVLSRLVIDFPSQSDTFYFSFQWIFEETLKTWKVLLLLVLSLLPSYSYRNSNG